MSPLLGCLLSPLWRLWWRPPELIFQEILQPSSGIAALVVVIPGINNGAPKMTMGAVSNGCNIRYTSWSIGNSINDDENPIECHGREGTENK